MKIIITKLEITSFGCLKNKIFTPSEKMNKITAPNESGKSTMAAFIKFIFYGFGSSKKDIMDSHKKMYLPWDSPMAAGAIELCADGVSYRIERKYAPHQKEHISIIEISSGKAVFAGLCPGEVFFGANLETAEKTFIFDQYCALTARDSELFDSIRNMIFQGDESGNCDNALKRLKEAKKELKNSRGGGVIATLQKDFETYKGEYDKSMDKINTLKEINASIAQNEKNIERNTVNEKKLLDEKENIEKYNALLKLKELEELEKETQNAENAYKIAVSSLEGAGIPDTTLLDDLVCANAEKLSLSSASDELKSSLSSCEKELSTLEEKSIKTDESTESIKSKLSDMTKKSKMFFLLSAVLAVLGVACGIVSFINMPSLLYPAIALILVSLVMVCVGLSNKSSKAKYIKGFGAETETELLALLNAREETELQKIQKTEQINSLKERITQINAQLVAVEEKLSSVLGRYFKSPTEDSAELIKKLRNISEKVAEAKKIAESKRASLIKTAELLDISALREKAVGAKTPERPLEEIEKQLRFVQNGIKLMEDKIIQAEKEKAVIESSITPPSTLYEKAEASYKKLTQASSRLEAIELAIELIEKASEEMKASLAPKITSYASELFSIATDGKYQALNVTTELSLTTDNGETVKSAEYLSAGARATAYICLRLALLKAVYNDTLPPIIFDDAFVRLDKTRIEQIFKAIMASPAKDAQIFVFSATDI